MTVYFVPGTFGVGGQILDSNGKPAAGALINTYAAGTSSPVATFTTIAGNVTAANPIVAGSDGRLTNEMWQAEGQAIRITLTDSMGNTLGGPYDNLRGVNDPYAISGIALLNSSNTFSLLNVFSNVSANYIQATSIAVSALYVSSVFVSSISASTISAIGISSLTVTARSLIASSAATISNLTISGTGIFNGSQLGRTVTGSRTATSLGPGGALYAALTNPLNTNEVQLLLSVSAENPNYMAYAKRADDSLVIYRGYTNSVTSNVPSLGGGLSLGIFNNHSATQTMILYYMIVG